MTTIEQARQVEQRLREIANRDAYPCFKTVAADTIASLIAELEAAQKDAARYQWLRSTTNFVTSKGERIDVRESPDLWDESIDAAIAAGGAK